MSFPCLKVSARIFGRGVGVAVDAVVATQDRTVNPELERWMYRRSGAKITEVAASHMIVMSQPQAVADAIVRAALGVE